MGTEDPQAGNPDVDAVERVRQLIEIMAQNDLAELEVEQGDLRVKIRKNLPPVYGAPGYSLPMLAHSPIYPAALQAPAQALQSAPGTAEAARDEKLIDIASPMVGTFYRAPNPSASPYVNMGSEVTPDTVVCIIEAMKVMNEIKAEVTGTVAEILIEDGEPVEFGQVLFLLEPPQK
jgi:acetyl-CoA carboxylase biotin carboxyl carrier protein